MKKASILFVLVIIAASAVSAATTVIDFEDLNTGNFVQVNTIEDYPVVSFSDPWVTYTRADSTVPPHSGSVRIFPKSTEGIIRFDTEVCRVKAWITVGTSVTTYMRAYDSNDELIDTDEHGYNMFHTDPIEVSSVGCDISYVVFEGPSSYYAIDDLEYDQPECDDVPEFTALGIFAALGTAGMFIYTRRR